METPSPYALIALETLAPSPTNPRKSFDEAALKELADTIRSQGVLAPIVVRLWPDDYPTPDGRADRPLYEIVAGERRYRASRLAELAEIPAMVRVLSTRQVLEIQLIENLQRRDVTELEEAEGYHLMMRDHGYTADQLAEKVGKSRAYIYGRLKLTALCEVVRERYRAGELDASRALLIARIPVPALQVEAAKAILDGWQPMSYRVAAQHIQNNYMLDLTKAPFPRDDTFPGVFADPCTTCPKRAGNAPELYPDTPADVCTDPRCYTDKKAAYVNVQAERAKEAGHKVIIGTAAKKIIPHGVYKADLGDHVALDHKSYYGDKETTARKAIKGQDVAIVMIEDARTGTLVPAVAKKDLNEALKANGVRVSTSSRDPRDLAKERARKDEQKFRRALFDAHHTATAADAEINDGNVLNEGDLALIARQFWARLGSEAQKIVARMYFPTAPAPRDTDSGWTADNADYLRGRAVTEMIDGLTKPALVTLLLDIALVGTLDVPTYIDDISTPIPLLAAVHRAGLDPEAIRAEAADAPKGKSAAQPTPTPPEAPRGGEGNPAEEAESLAALEPLEAKKWRPAIGDHCRVRDGAGTGIKGEREHGVIVTKIDEVDGRPYCTGKIAYPPVLKTNKRGRSEDHTPCIESFYALGELSPWATPAADQAVPAADALAPARAKQAAPAAGKTAAKPKKQAATAAKKPKEKAKSSGRASPAERKGKTIAAPTDDAPVTRCDRTVDMIDTAFPELKVPAEAGQEVAA